MSNPSLGCHWVLTDNKENSLEITTLSVVYLSRGIFSLPFSSIFARVEQCFPLRQKLSEVI